MSGTLTSTPNLKTDTFKKIVADTHLTNGTTVSIIVPCYNEVDNINPFITAIKNCDLPYNWEIIFVDDNSPDGTTEVVRHCAALDPRIRGIRRLHRKGLASAVIEGVLSSSASLTVVMDGDLQHDEACIKPMLHEICENGYDLAVASRMVAGGTNDGLKNNWRRALSLVGCFVTKLLLPVPLKDPMSGFFAFKRDLFEEAAPRMTGSGFKILLDFIFTSKPTLKIKEVPMVFRPRLHGESKLDLKVSLKLIIFLVRSRMKKQNII